MLGLLGALLVAIALPVGALLGRSFVSADGKFFWNESQVSEEELFPRLQAEAAKEPQPDLHIRGDKNVRYEFVAQAMAAAQRAGVRKIGFVTDPQGQ